MWYHGRPVPTHGFWALDHWVPCRTANPWFHASHPIPLSLFLGSLRIFGREWYAVAEPATGEPFHAAYSHAAQRPESGVRPVHGMLYRWVFLMEVGCLRGRRHGPTLGNKREPRGYESTPIRTPVDEISHHQATASVCWREGWNLIVQGANVLNVLNGGPPFLRGERLLRQRTGRPAATFHTPPSWYRWKRVSCLHQCWTKTSFPSEVAYRCRRRAL